MLEVDKKREATASIRGYFYQLDAALLEILNADLSDEIVIEGIEDFDRYTDESVIYGQVKYYAEQNLTDSVLRAPLHKLFVHFHGLEEAQRAGRKYLLYGHFSEVKIDIGELSVERFKSVMEYRKEVKAADGTKSYEKKSLLDGMAAPDRLIEAFCKSFSIQISKEFSEHRRLVIEAIRKNQSVSGVEAEGFHYPMAFDYIATLATKKITTTVRSPVVICRNCSKVLKLSIIVGFSGRRMQASTRSILNACTSRSRTAQESPVFSSSNVMGRLTARSSATNSEQLVIIGVLLKSAASRIPSATRHSSCYAARMKHSSCK
ncbi:hypothetical protein LNO08_04485 [Klebsiella pneumoniae subsp. pneumoniae]|nr:hypothetical protein [Klebsiella pneumoniae subsp. pneumoniae]